MTTTTTTTTTTVVCPIWNSVCRSCSADRKNIPMGWGYRGPEEMRDAFGSDWWTCAICETKTCGDAEIWESWLKKTVRPDPDVGIDPFKLLLEDPDLLNSVD